MKLRRLIVLASGGLMLLGGACGGDSKESSNIASTDSDAAVTSTPEAGGNSAASSGAGDLAGCETIGADEVAGIFGGDFTEMQDTTQGATIICNTQRGEPVTSVQYTIKPTSAGEYDATIKASKGSGATVEPVSGIGTKATRLTTKAHGVTVIQLLVVKGTTLFFVTATADGESVSTQAEQLAKLLADNL